MKKLLASLMTAGMLAAGLVTVSSAPAQALCDRSYQGPCPEPSISRDRPRNLEARERPRVRVNISAPVDRVPKGRLIIRVKKIGGGVDRSHNKWYPGGARTYKAPRLGGPGRYKITVTFIPRGNLAASREVYFVRVRRG